MAKTLPAKSFELEFTDDGFAKVRINGEEIPAYEVEITKIGNDRGIVQLRQIHVVGKLQIVGEPSGDYLNVEKSNNGDYETIKVTLNKES